jgi:hypothetical protein
MFVAGLCALLWKQWDGAKSGLVVFPWPGSFAQSMAQRQDNQLVYLDESGANLFTMAIMAWHPKG